MGEKTEAILTMAVLLLVIMLLIALGFCIFFKGVRIKDTTARKIEIFGYYLLVVLLVWQFGIKNISMGEFYDLDIYMIKEKLDYIFLGIQRAITGEDMSNIIRPYHNIENGYTYVGQQLIFIDIAEMVLQLSSTICIAIGRFQELRTKKEKNN